MNMLAAVRTPLTFAAVCLGTLLLIGSGCQNRPTIIPPPDPNLRKTISQLAADAAKRHPFKADTPSAGQAVARAEIDYGLDVINLVNLSDEEWQSVEVWVNREYVVFVPVIRRNVQQTINLELLYNDSGKSFPTDSRKARVQKLETLRDGKLYEIPLRLAD